MCAFLARVCAPVAATAAWPRGAAAGGQVRAPEPPVEKPPCALAASPHTRRSRVASAKGIWGRGYPEPGNLGEDPRSALKVVSGRDYLVIVRVWVARSVQYQVELE